jgi:hypothetical protein
MIDSGSSGNFISSRFVEKHGLPLKTCDKKSVLEVALADGRTQQVYCMPTKLQLHLGKFGCRIQFQVTDIGSYDILLGLPWLRKFEPVVYWNTNRLLINGTLIEAGQPRKKSSKFGEMCVITEFLRVKRLSKDAVLPVKCSEGAAGYDLASAEVC